MKDQKLPPFVAVMPEEEARLETKQVHHANCRGGALCKCPIAWEWDDEWWVDVICDNGEEESIKLDDYLAVTRRAQ